MKIASSEQVVFINCSECQKKQKINLCAQHVLSLQFLCTELVIQWTILCDNCGLVDARISASEFLCSKLVIQWTIFIILWVSWYKKIEASDKDLPVSTLYQKFIRISYLRSAEASQFFFKVQNSQKFKIKFSRFDLCTVAHMHYSRTGLWSIAWHWWWSFKNKTQLGVDSKGYEISKWIYEVVTLPKIQIKY